MLLYGVVRAGRARAGWVGLAYPRLSWRSTRWRLGRVVRRTAIAQSGPDSVDHERIPVFSTLSSLCQRTSHSDQVNPPGLSGAAGWVVNRATIPAVPADIPHRVGESCTVSTDFRTNRNDSAILKQRFGNDKMV